MSETFHRKQNTGGGFEERLIAEQSSLYAFLYIRLGNRSDAEEVLQETNRYIIERRADLRSIDGFRPWAKTMADIQQKKYRTLKRREQARLCFLADIPETPEDAQEEIDTRLGALAGCLAKLDKNALGLVRKRYWEDRPLCELTRGGKKSSDAIAMQLMRIRRKLAACLRKRCAADVAEVSPESAVFLERLWDGEAYDCNVRLETDQLCVQALLWFWRRQLAGDRELSPRRVNPLALAASLALACAFVFAFFLQRTELPKQENSMDIKTTLLAAAVAPPLAISAVTGVVAPNVKTATADSSQTSAAGGLLSRSQTANDSAAGSANTRVRTEATSSQGSLNTVKPVGTIIYLLGN